MSRLALRNKSAVKAKFPVRDYHRCEIRWTQIQFLRRFRMCRICFRLLSLKGEIPGVRKSSW